MVVSLNLTEYPNLSAEVLREIQDACENLAVVDHLEYCPVRHGASAQCCWPVAVCVPQDVVDRRLAFARRLDLSRETPAVQKAMVRFNVALEKRIRQP